MKLTTLRSKALKGDLEVEHILRAAKKRVPGLADELDRLTLECGWSDGGMSDDGLIVPLRRWARVASAYIRGGCIGIVTLTETEPAYAEFAIALLEEIHSKESVQALMDLAAMAISAPKEFHSTYRKIVLAYDSHLSIPPDNIPIPEADSAVVRSFLHQALAVADTEMDRGIVLYALRGVGDEESLRLVEETPAFAYPREGLADTVRRAIKRRLRMRTATGSSRPET